MLKKKTSFWDEYKYIILAFFSAALTMAVIYFCNQMIPFGDKTILRMDLYHQYGPLFAELYERVMNGDGLTYSWVSGLGSCFLGNYFNYLSSPIGAIVLFFGHKNVTEAIAAMILLKAALSSATFTFYIKRSLGSQNFVSASFGVFYAFCGYMLAYYWNVMWLDAMVLLPIVLLGIERIINHGKMATYVTGLALSMFSNYYMSFMLCIFSVIYFIYYFATNYSLESVVNKSYAKRHTDTTARLINNRFLRSGVIFALGSLCAGGLMAVVLLPVYSILQGCSATSGTFPTEFESYFTFFDFFANHFSNLTTTIRSSGDDVLPNVYCGVLTIILAPLFFFAKSISKKEKITTLFLLVVLYASFNLNFLNYIWHGLHFPNDLPYRFSFIYSFILLVIAYKTFQRLNEFTALQIGTVGTALVAFVFLAEKITSKNVGDGSVVLTLILTILYVVVLTIFKDKKYQTASVAALLLVCVCSEAIMCDTNTVSITVDKEPYVSDLSDFNEMKEKLDTVENGDFYRMELTNLRTRMDPSWYYYNGVSVFSSMAYEKLANMQDRLGMMSNTINSYTYNPQTPVYNMMFSLKYIVNNSTVDVLSTSPNYTQKFADEKFQSYQNNYYLPIAYLVHPDVKQWATEEYITSWEIDSNSDPFALQGDYFDKATGGLGNPFERINLEYVTYTNLNAFTEALTGTSFRYDKITQDIDGSAIFHLNTTKDSNIYIYFDVTGAESGSITIDSKHGNITHSADQDCILDIGYYNSGDSLTVTIPCEENSGTIKFVAYTLNKDIMDKGYTVLSDQQMFIEKFDNSYISGRVSAIDDCLLYTSIPYDKGWNVYIDGEKADKESIVKVGDALLGVNITSGNHTVEFKYKVPALTVGVALTVFTIICIGAYYLIINRNKNKKKLLPKFAPISNNYSTDILLTAGTKLLKPVQTQTTQLKTPTKQYGDKQIIYPPISNALPKKQIIIPPVTIIEEIIDRNDEF